MDGVVPLCAGLEFQESFLERDVLHVRKYIFVAGNIRV